MKRINISMDDASIILLDSMVKVSGQSKSGLIRKALAAYEPTVLAEATEKLEAEKQAIRNKIDGLSEKLKELETV